MEYKPYRRPDGSERNSGSSAARRSTAPRSAQGARGGSSGSRFDQPGRGGSRFGDSGRGGTRTAQSGRGSRFDDSGRGSRFDDSGRGGASRTAQPARGARYDDSGRGSRYGEARPARPMPRRRRRDPAAILIPAVVGLALLIAIVYVGASWFISTINKSTYCSNIYINGIEISPYSKEEGMEVVRELTAERLNAVHELKWEDESWSFSAADFGASVETDAVMNRAWNIGHVGNIFDRSSSIRSLRDNPIYLEAPVSYNQEQVDGFVDTIYNALYVPPRNAEVAADMNSPYLASEATVGRELDRETARAQIISLLETGEGSEVLPVIELEPSLSTEEALSSLDLIVEYKTDVTARGYYGRFNVRKGLLCFYGMIVQPGEEVSFNSVVGERNEARGWQPGTEYIGGGKTQEGYGGGICQASSTLYGALLKAGMTILERWPHSMTVAYVDPSIDAAVTNTSKDLRFRNDTENAITIYTEVDKEYATVKIYGARPKYRYELESDIISQDTSAKKTGYIADEEGKYCYYTDETKLYQEGHAACISDGWVVAYDWDTGAEVDRRQLSHDQYASGYDIYWRGIHSRDEGAPDATAGTGESTGTSATTENDNAQ